MGYTRYYAPTRPDVVDTVTGGVTFLSARNFAGRPMPVSISQIVTTGQLFAAMSDRRLAVIEKTQIVLGFNRYVRGGPRAS